MEPVRVLVVDDHADFRDGLRALLDTAPSVEVVAECGDGATAIELATRLQPDVLLMDLNMPGMGGVEATRRVLRASPHLAVLVLSMADDADTVFEALRAGARGYLLKGARRAEILRAVEGVAAGEAIFGPAVAARLIGFLSAPAGPDAFPQLTPREREILDLIAQHVTNPEIAARLGLTAKTVRNHVSNIFAKLQVADRAQAIITAREGGLGRPGDVARGFGSAQRSDRL